MAPVNRVFKEVLRLVEAICGKARFWLVNVSSALESKVEPVAK